MNKKILAIFLIFLILGPANFVAATPGNSTPDLTVKSAVFFPAKPFAGVRAVLIVTVENLGDSGASPVVVSVDLECGRLTNKTRELAGRSSVSVEFAPLFLDAGNYSIKVTVDPFDEVLEGNETNNELGKWVEVVLPDVSDVPRPTKLDFGKEERDWGFYNNLPSAFPGGNAIPNYNLMGRSDPNDASSKFEEQSGNACGTTSLAGILRYLSGVKDYNHHDIDECIRGGGTIDIFTDPFSAADFARSRDFVARVYVEGDFQKIKWFIDHGIPTMIIISTTGEKGMVNAHWIVPIAYWEDSTKTQGLSSPTIIGYYNPWGHQCAIPQSRLELYWVENTLGTLSVWYRAYIAVTKEPAPPDMPPSNVDGVEYIYMTLADWFTDSINRLGQAVGAFRKGLAYWGAAIVGTIAGVIATVVTGISIGVVWLGRAIWEGLKWLGNEIKEAFEWLGCKLGLDGCKTKKEYFYYFYSTSPCAESMVFLNGMIKYGALGYVFNSPGEGRVPLYEYVVLGQFTEEDPHAVLGYFISTDGTLTGKTVEEIRDRLLLFQTGRIYLVGQLGYALKSETDSPPPGDCPYFSLNDLEGVDYDKASGYTYLPKYHFPNSQMLWSFPRSFLSTDEAAGTYTFPYVAFDKKGKETAFLFTREYVAGYIYYNQQPGTVPLYRFYDQKEGEFYLTTNLEEEPKGLRPVKEMVFSNLVGYILKKQMPDTVPLYRYYAKEKGAHYLFTTKEIVSDKFTKEKIIGYVYQYKEECTTELWIYCSRKVKEE